MKAPGAGRIDAVTRISLPTPLPVGNVNCWLLEGDPLTLVDCGPLVAASLAALDAGLAAAGRRVEDVELLLLTHQHVDHVGAAAAVVERAGCEVTGHELLAAYVAELGPLADAETAYQDAVLALHGAPAERRERFWDAVRDRRAYWGDPVTVTLPLAEGGAVPAGGRMWRAAHRPGHSPTDTIFVEDEERVALSGDHLLGHISSNPLVARPLRGPADPRSRSSSVRTYLDSLAATAEDDLTVLLPGHGRPVRGHRALIAERVALHFERAEQVAALLGPAPRTAFDVAADLWPRIALNQTYLTVCETLGALDLLEEQGRVRQLDDGDVIRYAAA